MAVFHRRADVDDIDDDDDVVVDETPERYERREVVEHRWHPANALVVLAGAALAAIGIVALARTEIDESWYEPVTSVLGANHTPLLAAIEVGVGALLIILGLAGARAMTAFVCLIAAVAAAVAAIDPGLVDTELAIERSWAVILAAAAGGLAVLLMLPWPTTTSERRASTVGRRRRVSRPVEQH
jgi:hypothetical protein